MLTTVNTRKYLLNYWNMVKMKYGIYTNNYTCNKYKYIKCNIY